jgi:glutamate decarboxylase
MNSHPSSGSAPHLPPDLPHEALPEAGMRGDVAYELIRSHLLLDGSARLNLATFVGTWMEPEARRLMEDCADKNLIDKDEYPQTADLEQRCLRILAHLWNAPDPRATIGASTTGSSEGCMLAGLVMRWHWRERRRQAGRESSRPNVVMGSNRQVCWDKFCAYFDVEPRFMPLAQGRLHLTAPEALELCDERTIGVVAVLGSVVDGSYEPIAEIAHALDALEERTGIAIPLHVDAASGGFVAPPVATNMGVCFLVWDGCSGVRMGCCRGSYVLMSTIWAESPPRSASIFPVPVPRWWGSTTTFSTWAGGGMRSAWLLSKPWPAILRMVWQPFLPCAW